MIFTSIFGTNRENTDVDEYLPSSAATLFLQGVSLRAQNLKLAFPNCKIAVNMFGIYDTAGFPSLVLETEKGIRNFLLYINREAPFIRGWAYDVNVNDPTPDDYAKVFDDIDIGIGQLFLPLIYENDEVLEQGRSRFSERHAAGTRNTTPTNNWELINRRLHPSQQQHPGYDPEGDYNSDGITNGADPTTIFSNGWCRCFF